MPCPPCHVQVRAIFEAAVNRVKAGGKVQVDIMVPLVGAVAELRNQEQLVRRVAQQVSVQQSHGEQSALTRSDMVYPHAAPPSADLHTTGHAGHKHDSQLPRGHHD